MKKKKLGTRRIFGEKFKRARVEEIESGKASVSEVCRCYKVSSGAVYKWIYKYSSYLEKGKIQLIEMEGETRLALKQEERIKELEAALGRKQLEIDYLSKVLELSSLDLGVDLKKKYATKY